MYKGIIIRALSNLSYLLVSLLVGNFLIVFLGAYTPRSVPSAKSWHPLQRSRCLILADRSSVPGNRLPSRSLSRPTSRSPPSDLRQVPVVQLAAFHPSHQLQRRQSGRSSLRSKPPFQRLSRGMQQARSFDPAPLNRTELPVGCADGNRQRMVLQLDTHGEPSKIRAIASAVLLIKKLPS